MGNHQYDKFIARDNEWQVSVPLQKARQPSERDVISLSFVDASAQ
jgi:hypothetical protein